MGFFSDFGSAYIRHLRHKLAPSSMWTKGQIEDAESIAKGIERCKPITEHFDGLEHGALIDGINSRDEELIDEVLDTAKKYADRPWCIDLIKIAISLSLSDSPDIIRLATTNLIGPDVMWD